MNLMIISTLNKIKLPWNVNGLAQLMAKYTLENTDLVKTRSLIKKESNPVARPSLC